MAILDNLLTLVTDGDPGAITAWDMDNANMKLLGSPIDVSQIDVYKIAGSDTNPIWTMPSDSPLFMNVFVKKLSQVKVLIHIRSPYGRMIY